MAHITDIISKTDAEELQNEFNDIMESGADYDDVEELLFGYGLEMDYVFDLIGF